MKAKTKFYIALSMIALGLVLIGVIRFGVEPYLQKQIAKEARATASELSKASTAEESEVELGEEAATADASKKEAANEKKRRAAVVDRKRAEILRTELKKLLRAAAQEQEEQGDAQKAKGGEAPTIDKEYIKDAIGEIVPLLKECMSMVKSEDGLSINGRLPVQFEISGDPELGGVIGASQILDGGTIQSASFRECVRETMYAIVLDAPEQNGVVTVRYPFVFQDSGGQESENAPASE